MRLPSPRKPWIVAALGDHARLAADAKRAAKEGANLLEVRADCFPAAVLKPESLRALLKQVRSAVRRPLLLTLRSRAEGGKLPRAVDEQDRLALVRAALSEVDAVDVELSAEDIAEHVVDEAHKRRRWVVVSSHHFKGVPSDRALRSLARRFKRLKGDLLKVAALPSKARDAERLMAFCAAQKGRRAFIAMGPLGRRTRLDPARWGSCLTYGYVRKPLAPGQFSVKALSKNLNHR